MKFSIIICTRNRDYALPGCLDSVATAITYAKADAEIVLVDNASTDATRETVERWGSANPTIPLQILLEPKKGLSNARNCGMHAAHGDIIAFTDDDCQLIPEYVARLLAYYAADTVPVMRGGSVHLGDPTDLPLTIKLVATPHQRSRAMNSARTYNLGDSLLGCNMALPRADAMRIGDFDTRFGAGGPIPSGEDIDYVMRAYFAGLVIAYEPDLAVLHFHGRKSPEQGQKLLRDYGVGTGALYAKYLFRYPIFVLPFYWDFLNIFRDMIKRRNNFIPEMNVTHRDKMRKNFQGIWKYYTMCLCGTKASA
ncbi:MAG: glycosyltransferase family 2 protein [Rickettsiales bacterium]